MAPPAKKRRAASAAATTTADPSVLKSRGSPITAASNVNVESLLSQTEETTKGLCALLDKFDATNPSGSNDATSLLLAETSAAFLSLKSQQRSLCLSVESHLVHDVVSAARDSVGTKTLELQNLVYERDYLRERVRECREFGCGQLVKMARDELGGGAGGAHGDEEDDKEKEDGVEHKEEDDDNLINAFLSRSSEGGAIATAPSSGSIGSSYDHRDPQNHGRNISHLKTELTLRRTTEADLTRAKAELAELKKHCASRKSFLTSLPRKLREVERSTGPLQNFFREATAGLMGSDDADTSMSNKCDDGANDVNPTMLIGSDRTARIEAARSLPVPLYTVFLQLNGYLDAFASAASPASAATTGGGSIKVDVINETPSGKAAAMSSGEEKMKHLPQYWIARHDKAVVLSIPVPTVEGLSSLSSMSSGGGDISIKFSYLPRLGVVTATASGNGDDGRILLSALFPDDDGTTLPSCAAPFLLEDTCTPPSGGTVGNDSSNPGTATATAEALADVEVLLLKRGDLPYRWSQFIAGLIFPPSKPDATNGEDEYYDHRQPMRGTIEPSTRSVVRSLTRRIRARTTLTALLNMLGRGKVPPVHVALSKNGCGGSNTRLTSWSEKSSGSIAGGGDRSCKYYVANFKHGNGSTLKATVKIDPTYPAVPPLWSLQPATANLDEEVGAQCWGEREGTALSLHSPTVESGSPPLYDPAMGAVEDAINADLESLVVDNVEDTFDWILAAQVNRLLECFDSLQSDGGSASVAAGAGGKLVSYDLYCNGL